LKAWLQQYSDYRRRPSSHVNGRAGVDNTSTTSSGYSDRGQGHLS
ncbi:2940_t:CDS:1, partial [Paraglomus occultum]